MAWANWFSPITRSNIRIHHLPQDRDDLLDESRDHRGRHQRLPFGPLPQRNRLDRLVANTSSDLKEAVDVFPNRDSVFWARRSPDPISWRGRFPYQESSPISLISEAGHKAKASF
jgi:hypothetical protein